MRVSISVAGVFHGYQLAEQLNRYGALAELITTYPPGYVEKRMPQLIPRWKIRSNWLQLAKVGLRRIGRDVPATSHVLRTLHDAFALPSVRDDLDLFVGWSSNSIRCLERAKRLGVRTAVVRGSSHILEQKALLEEEYASYGIDFRLHQPSLERELREYELADYVQTNSGFARDTLVKHGVAPERVLMANTGVDLSLFRPAPKEDDVFRVVFAGTLNVRKGARYLLQAFSELDLPDIELWHLGRVSDEVADEVARYSDGRVKLLGFKPMAELYRWYSQCSVFVMPSIEEGLAVVQAQAMACGLPLICTPNTGGADFMSAPGREGFVVPIRDVEALKERIVYLYEHPEERVAMGRAARERVASGFTWEDYGARIMGIYRRILAQ